MISASLLSCRALSKPKAFPPGGDKEAAGEAGGVSLRAARPRPAPTPRAPQTPPSVPRAQVAGRGHRARAGRPGGGAGARAGAGTAMPTLEPVAERDRHGEHTAPAGLGLRGRQRGTRRRGGRLVRDRAACGGGTEGRRDGAGGGTLPSPVPPRPARPASLPLPSAPRRRHQSSYYAGRRARRPAPLLENAENAPRRGRPGVPPSRFVPRTSSSPFPLGPRFPVKQTGTTLVLTSWNGSEDPSNAGPSSRELNSPFAFCAARTFRKAGPPRSHPFLLTLERCTRL